MSSSSAVRKRSPPTSPRDCKRARINSNRGEKEEKEKESDPSLQSVADEWLRSSDAELVRRGFAAIYRHGSSEASVWVPAIFELFFSPHAYALKIEGLELVSSVAEVLPAGAQVQLVDVVRTLLRVRDVHLQDALVARVFRFTDVTRLGDVSTWVHDLLSISRKQVEEAAFLDALRLVERFCPNWDKSRVDQLRWTLFWFMDHPSPSVAALAFRVTKKFLMFSACFRLPFLWNSELISRAAALMQHPREPVRRIAAWHVMVVSGQCVLPVEFIRPLCSARTNRLPPAVSLCISKKMTYHGFRAAAVACDELPKMLRRLSTGEAHGILAARWKEMGKQEYEPLKAEIRLVRLWEIELFIQTSSHHSELDVLNACVDLSRFAYVCDPECTATWIGFALLKLTSRSPALSQSAACSLANVAGEMDPLQIKQLRQTVLRMMRDRSYDSFFWIKDLLLPPIFDGEDADIALSLCAAAMHTNQVSRAKALVPLLRLYLQHSDARVQQQACLLTLFLCRTFDDPPFRTACLVECGFLDVCASMRSLLSCALSQFLDLLEWIAENHPDAFTVDRQRLVSSELLALLPLLLGKAGASRLETFVSCSVLLCMLQHQYSSPTQLAGEIVHGLVWWVSW